MTSADSGRLKFVIRPSPILPEHRPLYKVSQILLILELSSRGGRSSLPRLQLFSWALKKPERRMLLETAARENKLNVKAWGFDPALVIALKYACAEQLVTQTSTGYEIADAGVAFVKDIVADAGLLSDEKSFMKLVGKKITESMIDSVVESWSQE